MAIFSKIKDMYRLQKQAKTVKNELKNIHIESEADGMVTVILSAEQELLEININENVLQDFKAGKISKQKIEEAIKKAMNKALKKAKDIGADKMKGIWGELTQK